jgi:hypothetical protein
MHEKVMYEPIHFIGCVAQFWRTRLGNAYRERLVVARDAAAIAEIASAGRGQ